MVIVYNVYVYIFGQCCSFCRAEMLKLLNTEMVTIDCLKYIQCYHFLFINLKN